MDKLHLKPYTFRGRMMWALYTAAIVSCIISLIFAYCMTHLSVQNELKLQQQTIAIYLLELDKRLGLSLSEHYTMTPSKSVTAVIGISPEQKKSFRKCLLCGKTDCPFRREG